nr:efflux RND transporter periplasmic adaptor subunit [uncultured Flavobacterium sp.]
MKVNYDVEVNTLAFPDEHYQGKIEKIYNVMDPETKAMKFRVRIPNSNYQLKPDMNCTVTVKYNENKQLISVPSDAIIFDKSKTWVMIFKDKFSIETREVEVYRHIGNTTYIASGLQPNEKIFSKNGLLIYNAQNE